ncbi:MAG: hypothetical protein ACFB10_16370 [Salibacteraceae bacterium]
MRLLLPIIILFTSLTGYTQSSDSTFVEFSTSGYQTWVVATMGTKGVLLSAHNSRKSSRRQVWEITGFNANLEESWKTETNVPNRQ